MTYFHEEQRFSMWVFVAVALIVLPVLAITLLATARPPAFPLPLLIIIVLPLLLILMFALAKLVVDVDQSAVHVSFHFLWPARHIRLRDIRRAKATTYNSLVDYGGWGVRLSPKGWAFNTGGHEGVLVETVDGKRVMIGSHRSRDLERAIAQAVAAAA